MAAFGFNTSASMFILNNLTKLSTQLAVSNMRLATTKRINNASDDPSGIIALAQFQSEISQIDAATANGQRIVSMLDTADGGLAEINDLLNTIDTKIIAASDAGATADEKAAYQLEIDSAINAINTIVSQTTFNGTRLLDGSKGYAISSVDSADIQDLRVNSANVSSGSTSVDVEVTAIAEKATLVYNGGNLGQTTDFTISGNLGSYAFSFASGTSTTDMVTAVNAQSDVTGVEATNAGWNLNLFSAQYGEDEFISVNVTAGTLPFTSGTTSDYGVDPTVTVDGFAASTDGLKISSSNNGQSLRMTLTESFGTALGTSTFNIDAGGAQFQLNANPSTRIDLGISSLNSGHLGNDTVGKLNTLKTGGANAIDSGNFNQASSIASASSDLISYERGRLGAISKYSVTSTLNAMASSKIHLTSAMSNIEDLDIVAETIENSRLQILMSVNTALLSTINTNNSNILTLLYGL